MLLILFFCSLNFQIGVAIGRVKVLWLGTSIPAGCSYPQNSCRNLHLYCINRAVSASFLCAWTEEREFSEQVSGLSLSMTRDEKEKAFRKYVSAGVITEDKLEEWKRSSYDVLLLPYLEKADIIILDHGYNDNYSMEKLFLSGKDNIEWDSQDRTSFVGAFNYMLDIIRKVNPDALIALGGYFQNQCTIGYFKRGLWVSTVLTWMAEHYNLPLLDVWNYTNIPDGYMPKSSHYLENLNEIYNSDFGKVYLDKNGNITYFQKFCPDGVHPFSDPTGESNSILDSIFTSLLRNIINTYEIKPRKWSDALYDIKGMPVTISSHILIINEDGHYKKVLVP